MASGMSRDENKPNLQQPKRTSDPMFGGDANIDELPGGTTAGIITAQPTDKASITQPLEDDCSSVRKRNISDEIEVAPEPLGDDRQRHESSGSGTADSSCCLKGVWPTSGKDVEMSSLPLTESSSTSGHQTRMIRKFAAMHDPDTEQTIKEDLAAKKVIEQNVAREYGDRSDEGMSGVLGGFHEKFSNVKE